ncbi:MAG: tyrosine-protein phosphatase [Pyrinomonadaceae bacterium]
MQRSFVFWLAASLSLTALSFTAAAQQPTPSRSLPNFHQVNSNLYRSGQPMDHGFAELAHVGIKTIVNLRDDDDRALSEEKQVTAAGMQYFNLPLSNLKHPNAAQLEKILAVINDPQNQPVLVHCKRGADRTGTIIACYRIAHDGWTGDAALKEAKSYGLGWWQFSMKGFIEEYAKMSPPKR